MKYVTRMIASILIFGMANCYSLGSFLDMGLWNGVLFLFFVGINIIPSFSNWSIQNTRLRNSADGCELLEIFLISTVFTIVYSVLGWMGKLPAETITQAPVMWILSSLIAFLVEAVVFWNGIIRIYVTSTQLGIKWRVIGALCGMIPIVHLIVLIQMMSVI